MRFTDNAVLIGSAIGEVQKMLRELDKEGGKVGLKVKKIKANL